MAVVAMRPRGRPTAVEKLHSKVLAVMSRFHMVVDGLGLASDTLPGLTGSNPRTRAS